MIASELAGQIVVANGDDTMGTSFCIQMPCVSWNPAACV